jgi:hypothetical protein
MWLDLHPSDFDPEKLRGYGHAYKAKSHPFSVEWAKAALCALVMWFHPEAKEMLLSHYGEVDLEDVLQNHLLKLGSDIGFFTDLGHYRVQDMFGVTWDRSIDRDIGNVEGNVLTEPSLKGYRFPDPLDRRFFCRYSCPHLEVSGPLSRVPDRFFAVRAGMDFARHAELVNGLSRSPGIRSRVVECNRGI